MEDPYKKDMFFVFVLVQSIFYPPLYSTQSLRRSVICLSAGEAKARLLPLRKANRPSFGGGGDDHGPLTLLGPAPSTNQHCRECLCALTKHKYLFSIEGLQGHGK